MSLGVTAAGRSAGYRVAVEFCADLDADALAIYSRNHAPAETFRGDISSLVDFRVHGFGNGAEFAYPPHVIDRRIANRLSGVHALVGGPPCQGHSSFNNRTRHEDPRNLLYFTMAAMAVALKVPLLIIENVPSVVNDQMGVVAATRAILKRQGYCISEGVLDAYQLGLPQTRRRFFMVGIRDGVQTTEQLPPLTEVVRPLFRSPKTLRWAIQDLHHLDERSDFDRWASLSARNLARIDYLLDNDEWDLPDAERPDCHRNGHTYPSVYGRLHWDQPAGTITTGFLTPGRGRYVHPEDRRALTPHEAARLQGLPDSYAFVDDKGSFPSKKTLSKVIGDAVPPVMARAAMLAALDLAEYVHAGYPEAAADRPLEEAGP
jgi:DNA (cytosine-5)-methyltransferase 1